MPSLNKKYPVLLVMYFLTFNVLFAEIKNGYGPDMKGVRESLKGLQKLLTDDSQLSLLQKIEIKAKVDKLMQYIIYFELTEQLLDQFRAISPRLYDEIDTIKNRAGQSVDVYVRFVAERNMPLNTAGTTNLGCLETNSDIYQSEYGPNTVSVKIASLPRSILLLAHEFGHVKYQVPNLSTYMIFYSANYQNGTFKSSYIGHHSSDLGGRQAIEYENLCQADVLQYLKRNTRVEKPLALIHKIQRAISKEGLL
jgi:hypothetical protein